MYLVCRIHISLSNVVRNLRSVCPDWDIYGKVVASEYRQRVLHSICNHPKTPTQISEEIEKHQSHVSKTLSELKQLNLVICLNQNAKKGRLYELTEQGEKIHSRLEQEDYFETDK